MATTANGLVAAWVIGRHDDDLERYVPFYTYQELRTRELYQEGNVVIYDRSRPLGHRWIVVSATHFDFFYEWV